MKWKQYRRNEATTMRMGGKHKENTNGNVEAKVGKYKAYTSLLRHQGSPR